MKVRLFTFSILLLTATALVSPARADVLRLTNGDRVSGTLTGVSAGKITFVTPFGGLEVATTEVAGLEGEGSRALKTTAGAVHEGTISATAELVLVQTGQTLVSVPWSDVAAIAETPDAFLDAAPPAEASVEEVLADKAAEEERKKLWSGHVDSGLTLRRGNTDTLDFSLGVGLKREEEGNVLNIKGLAAYGEVEEIINTRRYQGEAKWQVYPQERWYWFVLAGAERDDGRKLDLRANTALGLGRDFVKRDKLSLSADLGLDYAWERWSPFTPAEKDPLKESRRAGAREALRTLAGGLADGSLTPNLETLRTAATQLQIYRDPLYADFDREEEYLSLRGSANYQQTLFKDSTLSNALTAFANAEDFGEYRFNNELAFATPLTEALKLKISLRTEYNSLAEQKDADPWDNTLVTGLRYEF